MQNFIYLNFYTIPEKNIDDLFWVQPANPDANLMLGILSKCAVFIEDALWYVVSKASFDTLKSFGFSVTLREKHEGLKKAKWY